MATTQLVQYLFIRLHQLGVRALHGVPGDYNLEALDFVEPAGLHWVGDANELNAGKQLWKDRRETPLVYC